MMEATMASGKKGMQLGLGDDLERDCVERSEAREKAGGKKRSFSVSPAKALAFDREAERMRSSKDWSEASPQHLVSLWAWCYERVYGSAPALTSKERALAGAFAARMVREAFAGDVERAVAFLNWTWQREKGREKWRRENKREGGTLRWQVQFGVRQLVVEWTIDRERAGVAT